MLKTILRPRAQPEGEWLFSTINAMATMLPDWSDTCQAHGAGWPKLVVEKHNNINTIVAVKGKWHAHFGVPA